MANALFDAYREDCLDASAPDLTTVNIKSVLVDEGTDIPLPASDDFLNDIATGARVSTGPNFGSKTITAGTFDAADDVHTSVSGATVESIVIYNDTPTAETAKNLIAYIDTATGLPLTPNGGDVTIQWDSGANRIFTL